VAGTPSRPFIGGVRREEATGRNPDGGEPQARVFPENKTGVGAPEAAERAKEEIDVAYKLGPRSGKGCPLVVVAGPHRPLRLAGTAALGGIG